MAIKPITDKQIIDKTTTNRESQVSQRNLNTRGGGMSLKQLFLE